MALCARCNAYTNLTYECKQCKTIAEARARDMSFCERCNAYTNPTYGCEQCEASEEEKARAIRSAEARANGMTLCERCGTYTEPHPYRVLCEQCEVMTEARAKEIAEVEAEAIAKGKAFCKRCRTYTYSTYMCEKCQASEKIEARRAASETIEETEEEARIEEVRRTEEEEVREAELLAKGMVFCLDCSAYTRPASDMVFCEQCYAGTERIFCEQCYAGTESVYCGECGAKIGMPLYMAFCEICGVLTNTEKLNDKRHCRDCIKPADYVTIQGILNALPHLTRYELLLLRWSCTTRLKTPDRNSETYLYRNGETYLFCVRCDKHIYHDAYIDEEQTTPYNRTTIYACTFCENTHTFEEEVP